MCCFSVHLYTQHVLVHFQTCQLFVITLILWAEFHVEISIDHSGCGLDDLAV